eukprot:7100879-Pyramimonas_sp.AAC.1
MQSSQILLHTLQAHRVWRISHNARLEQPFGLSHHTLASIAPATYRIQVPRLGFQSKSEVRASTSSSSSSAYPPHPFPSVSAATATALPMFLLFLLLLIIIFLIRLVTILPGKCCEPSSGS